MLFRVKLTKRGHHYERVQRTITADTETQKPSELSTELGYSNAEILVLLKTIFELKGLSVSADEKADDTCDFHIGDMTYTVVAINN